MEMKRRTRDDGEPSNKGSKEEVWKIIWTLKVLSLVKHFIWKACHDILPTRMNFIKRRVIELSSCPICVPFVNLVIKQ